MNGLFIKWTCAIVRSVTEIVNEVNLQSTKSDKYVEFVGKLFWMPKKVYYDLKVVE